MLGWFYGYRKPMIGSASRRCWFSKAYFRFASARENAPAQTSFILRKVLDKEVYDVFEIVWVGCRTHTFSFLRLLCPFKFEYG